MIDITLNITPPRSTAQGSSTILKRGERLFIGRKSSSNATKAKLLFRVLLAPYKQEKALEGALFMYIEYCYPFTKRHGKKQREAGRILCTTRPDEDNIKKMLYDALVQTEVIKDDSYIQTSFFSKFYEEKGYVKIVVKEIGLEEQRNIIESIVLASGI